MEKNINAMYVLFPPIIPLLLKKGQDHWYVDSANSRIAGNVWKHQTWLNKRNVLGAFLLLFSPLLLLLT